MSLGVYFIFKNESSYLARLLDTTSEFALFSVSGLKRRKIVKKNTYTNTETCKLYSRVFWIFLPNVIIVDGYNVELFVQKLLHGFITWNSWDAPGYLLVTYCISVWR